MAEEWVSPEKSFDRIDRHVYLGGALAARDAKKLEKHGITRIVKMFGDDELTVRVPGVEYVVFDAKDLPDFDIRPAIAPAIRFIIEGARDGKKTLVHCHMGISRSSTIVAVYLMCARKMSLKQALKTMSDARPVVCPNAGFMKTLATIERQIEKRRASSEQQRRTP